MQIYTESFLWLLQKVAEKNYHITYQIKIKINKSRNHFKYFFGPTIRIGRESWCLPYAGFFLGGLAGANVILTVHTLRC